MFLIHSLVNQVQSLPIVESPYYSRWHKAQIISLLAAATFALRSAEVEDLIAMASLGYAINRGFNKLSGGAPSPISLHLQKSGALGGAGALLVLAYRTARYAYALLLPKVAPDPYFKLSMALVAMLGCLNLAARMLRLMPEASPSAYPLLDGGQSNHPPGENETLDAYLQRHGIFLNQQGMAALTNLIEMKKKDRQIVNRVARMTPQQLAQNPAVAFWQRNYGKFSKGLLLFGPPGTGKTETARLISCYLGVSAERLRIASAAELLNRYQGGTEEKIGQLFEGAKREWARDKIKAPLHVVIIDEFESIAMARSHLSPDMLHKTGHVNQLLTMLDGIGSPKNILVIAITNCPGMVDSAIYREGRLILLEIGNPDEQARTKIFEHFISQNQGLFASMQERDSQIAEWVKATQGFSGAELGTICGKPLYNLYQDRLLAENSPSGSSPLPDVSQVITEGIKRIKGCKPSVRS